MLKELPACAGYRDCGGLVWGPLRRSWDKRGCCQASISVVGCEDVADAALCPSQLVIF